MPKSRRRSRPRASPRSRRSLLGNLRSWTFDQSDFSLRLEVDVGPIERILLETEIGPDQQRAPYAGQNVRSGYAGQNVRYAGQNARLRYAGQNARLQGGSGD